MTYYVIQRISDGFYFEDFISEQSASWGAMLCFATEYPTYSKAYTVCKKINKKYGRCIAQMTKLNK